jgi:hypothetical protein
MFVVSSLLWWHISKPPLTFVSSVHALTRLESTVRRGSTIHLRGCCSVHCGCNGQLINACERCLGSQHSRSAPSLCTARIIHRGSGRSIRRRWLVPIRRDHQPILQLKAAFGVAPEDDTSIPPLSMLLPYPSTLTPPTLLGV